MDMCNNILFLQQSEVVPLRSLQSMNPKSQTLYLSYLHQEETLSLQQKIMLQLKEAAEVEKAKVYYSVIAWSFKYLFCVCEY